MIIRWIWKCVKCSDKVISYSDEQHTMNVCKCNESTVDMEEHYCRTQGEIEITSIKQLVGNKWIDIESE